MPSYKVTDQATGEISIVEEAGNPAQALRLATNNRFKVEGLDAGEAIKLMKAGAAVIEVPADPNQNVIPLAGAQA